MRADAEPRTDLGRQAEDMRVVLDESPHAGQARERAGRLVTVEDTELGHTDGKLLVTTVARVEDEAVTGAVHWLERPFVFLDVEGEHVVLVVLPVSGSLPELAVEHVGRDDYVAFQHTSQISVSDRNAPS